ncbi:MAG: 2,3-bisphosphoglycerate-independent phosphoglycerate mutase [Candidatus Peribacteraceae bacterium]|nr:2,3-bisphosphoglycerate-independent phosphoglycerate mutase [Candidatus Peribacteraceae bacterium]MDD5742255.1 2,3-bisphosphoglycerate-independent phosphoglycerate mutase [Candidatus Peribacteraceae bacterium]
MARLALIIIDGFGVAPPGSGNARSLAKLPTIKRLEQEVPNVIMQASGNAAGLPEGQQGASEPGHLVIGAGRIVWQPLEEINRAIRSKEFFRNDVLVSACQRAKRKNVPLHLLSIYSLGGVHGHVEHVHAMMQLAEEQGVSKIFLHLIGDGRDVPTQRFCADYPLLQTQLQKHPRVRIASLVGRYYAMDRDKQYTDRTKVAYDLYTQGTGEEVEDLCVGVQSWYAKAPEKEKTDYYLQPLKTADFVPIQPDDVVVCVNFRSDRMIQIVQALSDENFVEFSRPVRIKDAVCMGPYSDRLPVAFPAPKVENTLGEVVSRSGLKQLRIAETDKMAHVTFFFNAQVHEPFPGEDRILVESPKVPNFATVPEMSADELTDRLVQQVETEKYDFIVANFANPDLVGHGANIPAAVIACETVDRDIGRLLSMLEKHAYDWIVTSDHGHVEEMLLPDGSVSPSHTTNPVQTFVHSKMIASSKDLKHFTGIKDIAPLCLTIMGLPIPKEMKEGRV